MDQSGASHQGTHMGTRADTAAMIHARDWISKEDPDNPRNFSLRRRIWSTIAFTFLAFVTTFAASIYSAGIDDVARTMHVSEEVAILPLSLYNLGLAFGPLIGSPLSETAGRKIVILVTTPIFALFTVGAGFSTNVTSLIICRFFAGVAAAPAVGNASATITDYTAGRYRANSMAFYYAMPYAGALLGPLVGGFVTQAKSWRWTQWTTVLLTIIVYIPILFTKETYKKTILQRRAKRLGVEGPAIVQRSTTESIQHFATVLLFRPIHMLFTEPIVTLVCLYCGFLFGLMYTFVVASPWIYQHYYGFSPVGQNLSFLSLFVGAILAPIPLVMFDHTMYQPRLKRFYGTHGENERFPAEHRLYPCLVASFVLPACLFTFAWIVRPSIHWALPIILQGLTITTSNHIYSSANLFMMDAYGPLYGASAAGAAMLSRYTLSAAFPLFALKLYKGLGVGWATSLLGFCTLIMAPIPWLFWRWGETLRRRTKYETSA